MTDKQKKALSALAQQVKSNLQKLPTVEIINRIHYVTGKPILTCIQGYQLMRDEDLIPDEFVADLTVEGKTLTLLRDKRVILVIDQMNCTFVKSYEELFEEVGVDLLLERLGINPDF